MKGKIISVVAGVYSVYLENKEIVSLKPKGKFRHLNIKPCVGDDVEVSDGVICRILPRKNILIRPNIANIDLGIIVVSVFEPVYSSYLLDKFLTYLNVNSIKPLIVLSKVDLLKSDVIIDRIKSDYNSIGIDVIAFSKETFEGVEEIRNYISNKTIAFMGQTGVGKSSLINLVCPSFVRKVGEYSSALNRGKHQTKEVVIFPSEEMFIADTPGFSSLELDLFKEELKDYFPFFSLQEKSCFYLDCHHIKEPKCEIQQLVKNGLINEEHYNNYVQIYNELIYRKDRFK